MKHLLTVTAAISLIMWGCTKEFKDNGDDIDTSGYTLLKANIENLELPGYDAGSSLWNQDDMIGLFVEGQSKAVCWDIRIASEGKEEASFYGPVVKGERILGVFPYSASLEYDGQSMICELPGVQEYMEDVSMAEYFLAYNPYVFGTVDEGIIDFHYAFGLLEIGFDLAFPVEVTGLSIASETQFLSGRMLYDGSQLTATGASSNAIIIDFDGQSQMSDKMTAYAVVRPATYEDLVVTIVTADGEEISLKVPEITIERISSGHFTAGHITVSSSDLPSLKQEAGYWEEDK